MKKLIASILLTALTICACACGDSADSISSTADTTSAATSSSAATSTAASASNDNDAQINAGELEGTPSTLPELEEDTSSTFSIVVGPGEDESGWSEIF